jgi:hypothetical protein
MKKNILPKAEDSLTIILDGNSRKRPPTLITEDVDPGMDGMSIVEFDRSRPAPKNDIKSKVKSLLVSNPRSHLGCLLKTVIDFHESLKTIYARLSAQQEITNRIRERKLIILGSKNTMVITGPISGEPAHANIPIKRFWQLERRQTICNRETLTASGLHSALGLLQKTSRVEKFVQQVQLLGTIGARPIKPPQDSDASTLASLLLSKSLVYTVVKVFLNEISDANGDTTVSAELVQELEELRKSADESNRRTKELRQEASRIYADVGSKHKELNEVSIRLAINVFVTETHRMTRSPVPFTGLVLRDAQQIIAAALEAQFRHIYKKSLRMEDDTVAKLLSTGNFVQHVRDTVTESIEKWKGASSTFRWNVIGLLEKNQERE